MSMQKNFKELVGHFGQLPGIGPRQATRIVLELLKWPAERLAHFGVSITELPHSNVLCQQCFNISDETLCSICSNPKRLQSKIAVVENITDLLALEKISIFNGVYHVLGGVINPSKGILPTHLRLQELIERIRGLQEQNIEGIELILATNPTMYGETTALYIQEELKSAHITTTRLARGLAVGSSVEYAEPTTLMHAFKERKKTQPD